VIIGLKSELTGLFGEVAEVSPSLDTTLSATALGGTSPFVILDGRAAELVPLVLMPYFASEDGRRCVSEIYLKRTQLYHTPSSALIVAVFSKTARIFSFAIISFAVGNMT
jgi:hypothetical protein